MDVKQQKAYLATRSPLTIIMGYMSMFFIGMCYNSFKSSPKRHYDSAIAMAVHIAAIITVCYFGGWQAWLLTMFIPFFIPGCLGAYLFYVQHNFPGVSFAENRELNYEGAAMQSSSYLVMNPFMNWVTANIGYHHIHHLNSRIPFYRLPEAMAAIPQLKQAKRISMKWKDIKACMHLKIWDADAGQMTGLESIKSA
jgi:omega-6 fatty acid desaturase (delta-12 desaturase)